ncbi:MAG: GNAT family N-acetyltransferase, partial [Candidatus Cybelea sp.]
IRPYKPGDEDALVRVFRRAVFEMASSKYQEPQIRAWLTCGPTSASPRDDILNRDGFVAIGGGEILGWIELFEDSHIDRFYCVPEVCGKGVADDLYAAALDWAQSRGIKRLYCEASLFAESFFGRHGWSVDGRETVVCEGIEIECARMSVVCG